MNYPKFLKLFNNDVMKGVSEVRFIDSTLKKSKNNLIRTFLRIFGANL